MQGPGDFSQGLHPEVWEKGEKGRRGLLQPSCAGSERSRAEAGLGLFSTALALHVWPAPRIHAQSWLCHPFLEAERAHLFQWQNKWGPRIALPCASASVKALGRGKQVCQEPTST